MNVLTAEALSTLCQWFAENNRDLPWRASSDQPDAYPVWISEIMLQQTRVEAVIPYFQRFIKEFPDVFALANAEEEKLLKCWEGLGYYSRAKNLKKAAAEIVGRYNGKFPADGKALSALPGIGPYTAGAIGSIVFGLPTPAVDGNVLRVVARVLGDERDVLSREMKDSVTEQLASLYPKGQNAGLLTQGFMELGQTLCLAKGKPLCAKCPFHGHCQTESDGRFVFIPFRSPNTERNIVRISVFLLHANGKFCIRKRPDDGLLSGLWEFPNREEKGVFVPPSDVYGAKILGIIPLFPSRHLFTHIEWEMDGYLAECIPPEKDTGTVRFVTPEELEETYPIASAFRAFKEFIAQNKPADFT
ncbi:MAG: A/G-specific adenine glycosylase [Clostridia bacterium]|nr:A/G-specific adenine glycosylase [Clostridia bacterium]